MFSSWLFSLLFFAVCTVVLASGIFTLQSNHKAQSNRIFFAMTIAITIWSLGMAFSNIAPDVATCELWRRFSAVGWSMAYAVLLHFILIISDNSSPFKKWWFYVCLYLPALITLFAFAIPNGINPFPYEFYRTQYGWLNIAQHNIWDIIFYVYYIGYVVIGLLLLYRWGKKSFNNSIKKQSRIIRISIVSALILGTFTDVIFSSLFFQLPQLAPVIMLIPVLATYHTLQKESFGITESVDRKTSYIAIFVNVYVYVILSALQVSLASGTALSELVNFGEFTIRGIVVQIQMLISVYLVLKENRPGYIVSVMMNSISLFSSIIFLIRNDSVVPLPGIISYLSVLIIIKLIKDYKDKNTAYIKKINAQVTKEKFFSSVFKQAPVGIAIINDKNHTRNEGFKDININPTYEQILGRKKDELQNITWTEITHPEDLDADLAYFEQFKQGKIDHYSIEKRFIKPDGAVVWTEMFVAPFATSDGKSRDHVCIIMDITKRKEIEETLKYNNEHVILTGLYNRSVLDNVLKNDALTPSLVKRALVCINLSAMHELSLRYGFQYSQNKLKEIADSLKTFCRYNYKLFNIYNNHFVFYVKDYEDKKELTEFCKTVSNLLNSYLYVHGIGGGIGVIEIGKSDMNNNEKLLKNLMITSGMAAKSNHRDIDILFFGREIDIKVTRENEISQELAEVTAGIKTDRLYLQYQPVLDAVSNRICGFEALARLNSEKYGLISPSEFIPIAEKTNMIVPLGEKIIIQALCFLNTLKENKYDKVTISINISMIQLLKEGFANKLLDRIGEMHMNPQDIGVELTESVFALEREEINRVIEVLKDSGIKILIDDFGTGYSSFSRERELNIDCLKIDKSFIDKLMILKPEETITRDIISMAHRLGHCVVAEGVEYDKQLQYLRDHGCDRIQGYLISRPLDAGAALELLEKYK